MQEHDSVQLVHELQKLNAKLDVLSAKVDKLEAEQQLLLEKFSKHIDFINDTYEGLRNPIRVATRFFRK